MQHQRTTTSHSQVLDPSGGHNSRNITLMGHHDLLLAPSSSIELLKRLNQLVLSSVIELRMTGKSVLLRYNNGPIMLPPIRRMPAAYVDRHSPYGQYCC